MLRSRISIIALVMTFAWGLTLAQDKESKYAYALDSTMNKWSPTGIRLGVDIAGPIHSFFEPTPTWYEITSDIDFHKFFGVIEVGQGNYKTNDPTTNYTSNGLYYRLGADVNFIAKDPNLNVFFFGLRYATSTYNEKMSGELPSSGWGTQQIDLTQNNSKASWAEMTIGMRVRVWKSFFAGYTARLKMLKHNTSTEDKFESYYTPGYGYSERTISWGLNYYIQYRFEWRKKAIPWRNN